MNRDLEKWVEECAAQARPDRVVWIDGSEAEQSALIEEAVAEGVFARMNEQTHPNCFYHRSNPTDVARTEHLTFICAPTKDDTGPTNNWMSPEDAKAKIWPLYKDAMRGRNMYVIPYVMGPLGSPISKVGVEITDSRYVVANMRIMTRIGTAALEQLGESTDYCKGFHSLGDLSPDRRFIAHFPETRTIWSIGSGYGGNALLGKKCYALRIASVMARDQGWLAEHMLIVGIENPKGEVTYIAAAFPSACGKTNLAMLIPPDSMPGYKVWTVGDDIAWMKFGPDGRLYAINPENGFFGVAPGTSMKTNRNALLSTQKNSIFTNVALTDDGQPWWEGIGYDAPGPLTDWKGNRWESGSAEKAAHPNSRFTAPARQCPSISKEWETPNGVPISAIFFGGRRARTAPLIYESFDWKHGVFVGASMASETTAAATGAVGVVRRDPMAMLPFCGYNMGDYWAHWLRMGEKSDKVPKIFHVNWFRTGADGKFLWPGFGENLRPIVWALERTQGKGAAVETPIGFVPTPEALHTESLDVSPAALEELLSVDPEDWQAELAGQAEFFATFGDRLPPEIQRQHDNLKKRFAH
ncbi:MAG: phosphoenolpyruvate carboxykinase (GTP) [Candidatus Eisenbacteria bacterium]|nr:phosphoenolpyruvate carboxykinase (GTP) [Candidatus Eisenbacteria bacterium]